MYFLLIIIKYNKLQQIGVPMVSNNCLATVDRSCRDLLDNLTIYPNDQKRLGIVIKMSRVEQLQLSEICVSFQCQEKHKRLRALEKFRKIINNSEGEWSTSELSEMWQIMSKYIAKQLTDPSESCRNMAIEITKTMLESLPDFEKNIIYLMPVLVRRLGSQEILEPSEEVRLNCVVLLRVIIKKYNQHLPVYVDDMVVILAKTVVDDYPKIKSESCDAISELAKGIPAQFYTKSETIVKPILSNFSHQHYRIRVASIKTIGNVLLYGNNRSLEDVTCSMAARLFDQSGAVRNAVIEVVGDWLLNLRDRYSWWFKLIPLLLTGLHDEIEAIRVRANNLWSSTGRQYLQENESDDKIKDKLDYLTFPPEHYPPNIERPNLGCRIIVQQNIGKLVGGICRELDDWLSDIRVRSAQLLAVLVLNAEQDTIQHIEKLLPSMYKACADEDQRVSINVVTAAEYMGYFVPPQTYCRLVLPTIEDGNIHFGHLKFFAAILRGSQRALLSKELKTIANFLQQSYICRSKKANYQQELLKCCQALLDVCLEDCASISQELFISIFTVWSMSQNQSTRDFARQLLLTLSEMGNDKTLQEFYVSHLSPLLRDIKNTAETWTVHSGELNIFHLCLLEANAATLENVDIVLPILRATMSQDSDVELKLKLFILLSELLQRRGVCSMKQEDLNGFLVEFLNDILLPCLVWTAGRSAEALRTAAVGCLCALLEESADEQIDQFETHNCNNRMNTIFSSNEIFSPIFKQVKPILVSLIDDNSRKTRLFALRAIYLMIKNASKFFCVTEEDIIEIYSAIVRRLDDGCDDVRFAAIETLVFVWKVSKLHNVNVGESHVNYLYTSIIVHLDDPEECFQTLMSDAMMALAEIHPKMLADKIEKCKINFRNQVELGKLQDKCYQLINKAEQ
ncbi:dynein axonemal assembly factor 5 [Diachasmimorpha longicaudata]|uniref:dynein axonemal assembly factor 5 n=1 Tax=Diachasmimorpha longicaudata TaxID=58733 RepID=UPI0030B89365